MRVLINRRLEGEIVHDRVFVDNGRGPGGEELSLSTRVLPQRMPFYTSLCLGCSGRPIIGAYMLRASVLSSIHVRGWFQFCRIASLIGGFVPICHGVGWIMQRWLDVLIRRIQFSHRGLMVFVER